MERSEDKKGDSEKTTRDGPGLAAGDVASQETDPLSSDNDSSSPVIDSESIASPPVTSPPGTSSALVQDKEHPASGSIRQRSEMSSAGPSNVQSPKTNLDPKSKVPSPPRLPIISLGDESCPLMGPGQPFAAVAPPLNIPLVAIDGSRCLTDSLSSLEDSIKCLEGKKFDNLDVGFSPGKRKTRTSPIKDAEQAASGGESSGSESNPEKSPRQKKSMLQRILSPLRKRDKIQKDSETEMDTDSRRSTPDKSPTSVKKNGSPKSSPSQLENSPSRSLGKSPSKFVGFIKGVFRSKKSDESKPLRDFEGSGDDDDDLTKKKVTREDDDKLHDKSDDFSITDDFYITGNITSESLTEMSMLATDDSMGTNLSDGIATTQIEEAEKPSSKSDDDIMDENETS